MTCTIIGVIVTCLGSGPRLSPAEAAAIFTTSVPPTRTIPTYPPAVSSELPPQPPAPPPIPRRRLDGSLFTDPPVTYAPPLYVPYGLYNFEPPPFGYPRPTRHPSEGPRPLPQRHPNQRR